MNEDDTGAKAVVLKIFGPDLGEKLATAAGRGKGKNYRKVLEPTDPVTQCEKSGHPFEAGMPCYICGHPIPAKELLSGPSDELYVECEHVLPMTEGRWFLDIYMSKRKPDDEWTKRAIELEYDQAHRVCNQAKSNFSFIKTDPVTQNPVISEVGIKKVLLNIQVRARNASKDYKDNRDLKSIMDAIATTILKRADAIRARVQQIIDHINTGNVRTNPNYVNMVLLLRTALLADPSTLPGDLRTIHDKWYSDQTAQNEKASELLLRFMDETYLSYPQLRPENLMNTLFGGILSTEQQKQIVPLVSPDQAGTTVPSLLREILVAYFTIYDAPASTQKTLLSSIYYGVFKSVIEGIRDNLPAVGKEREEWLNVLCTLYVRVSVVVLNEPKVVQILGDLPEIPQNIKTQCEIRTKNAERDFREKARKENLLDEIFDEPPTPEEDADYFLFDLARRVSNRFEKDGIAGVDATSLEEEAKRAFIEAYPEGILRAKEAAANTADELVRIAMLGEDPAYADRMASAVFKFIINNRMDETTTYGGGLDDDDETLPNADGTSGGSTRRRLYAGLRKRVGSGTPPELRE